MNACRAGMSNAITIPPNPASTRICHAWISPVAIRMAKANARTIEHVCVIKTMFRFECRSATDPPQIENSIIGAEPTAATVPKSIFDPVS